MTISTIQQLISRGALFVVNHSGGKDSQAMYLKLRQIVPVRQLLVIHANLPEVDWPGIVDHIHDTVADVPIIVTQAVKTFFEMVEHRGMWPSPQQRQCTSDLKRGPIEREIRRYLKQHPEYGGLVVNCMGMRAAESPARAKAATFKLSHRNSKAGREWYDWLPIHTLTTAQVFASIAEAAQKPHWAYAAGMTRLSCCFCIMASRADITTAARLRPNLFKRYCDTEQRLNHTFTMPVKGKRQTLTEIVADGKLRRGSRQCPTELTEAGEQYVLPGAEQKHDAPGAQFELW